ncbi:MAG: citrate transporter [Candidatus Marinimicrobia bacterium]|nr:citrate transporter [Candidatus Neomarinimicrobiota bacterium]
MEIFQLVLFAVVFFSMVILMFFRKIPALLALPVMAFFIPLIAGVSIGDTIQLVIGEGATKLSRAYTVAIFGSMLSILLQQTGIARNFIKIGAELAGDNTWAIAVLMMSMIALLFSTLGGLGAVIMVGTIILPIMSSIGIGALTTTGIFLFGFSIGGILNVGNWVVYIDVLGMNINQVRPFALTMFGVAFLVALLYITVQLHRDGTKINFIKIGLRVLILIIVISAIFLGFNQLDDNIRSTISGIFKQAGTGIKYALAIGLGGIVILTFIHKLFKHKKEKDNIYWTAYLTPILPLVLILVFNMGFIAAFICGLLFGFLATYHKGSLNQFIQSIFKGGSVVMPAVVMFFGIGMLLNAIMGPGGDWAASHPEGWPVLNILRPLFEQIVPTSAWQYIFLFALAAPLALYRGPLNIWGMGYGVAAVFVASGLPAGAVMGMLITVGQIQGISDPTNTHNVWLANEMDQNVQKILQNTLPYSWLLAIIGLVFSAIWFM